MPRRANIKMATSHVKSNIDLHQTCVARSQTYEKRMIGHSFAMWKRKCEISLFITENSFIWQHTFPVMWRLHIKAWLTRQYFIEWVHEVFAPPVKKYLNDKNLPLFCLVMDNAPAHPPGLEEGLIDEFDLNKIRFLPPNTIPLRYFNP